jgi:hypothetical protein
LVVVHRIVKKRLLSFLENALADVEMVVVHRIVKKMLLSFLENALADVEMVVGCCP